MQTRFFICSAPMTRLPPNPPPSNIFGRGVERAFEKSAPLLQTVTMPVSRKPPGEAVDRRNGERRDVVAVRLAKFALPKRDDGRVYDPRVRRMWSALWDDQVTTVLTVADRELLIRWAVSTDDWIKARTRGWEAPITEGRNDQPVASPWFAIAKDAMAVIVECEKQIGIGSLNRARLNIAVGEAALTLDDVNERLKRPADQPGRQDPRIIPGVVEK